MNSQTEAKVLQEMEEGKAMVKIFDREQYLYLMQIMGREPKHQIFPVYYGLDPLGMLSTRESKYTMSPDTLIYCFDTNMDLLQITTGQRSLAEGIAIVLHSTKDTEYFTELTGIPRHHSSQGPYPEYIYQAGSITPYTSYPEELPQGTQLFGFTETGSLRKIPSTTPKPEQNPEFPHKYAISTRIHKPKKHKPGRGWRITKHTFDSSLNVTYSISNELETLHGLSEPYITGLLYYTEDEPLEDDLIGAVADFRKDNPEPTILQEAQNLIYGARRESYGKASTNFANIAKGIEVILGIPCTAEQVGLIMVWLKVCRHTNKPERDNLIDIAGYAGCIEQINKEG